MSVKQLRNIRKMAGTSTPTKPLACREDHIHHSLITTCYSRRTNNFGPSNYRDVDMLPEVRKAFSRLNSMSQQYECMFSIEQSNLL